ncbi:MAG: alpha-amylase family glycosyl hydrolase [Deinococcales bacterium]
MNYLALHSPLDLHCDIAQLKAQVSLRITKEIQIHALWVRSEPDNEEVLYPMHLTHKDAHWHYWQGEFKLNEAEVLSLYCFKYLAGETKQQYWLSSAGISSYFPDRHKHFVVNPHFKAPSWLYEQVFYQIFPERFCDGNPDNNVKAGEYLYVDKPVVAKAWHELPDRTQGQREFFGGDLEGILQKLDYLQDLGVTALYLTPIFSSPSSHKYDTTDYYQIDPHFGGEGAFLSLREGLRARAMRLILDIAVNHTSERHPWFDRYGEHQNLGAYRGHGSPTRDYYSFHNDDPESYHGWLGFVKTLPVLNYGSEGVRKVMYQSDEAILRYWLRKPYEIDGWRLDVIHMLGEGTGAKDNHHYVREFRRVVKAENPEAYLLGEHTFEASTWLKGDEEDAAMNYFGFMHPMWSLFCWGRSSLASP